LPSTRGVDAGETHNSGVMLKTLNLAEIDNDVSARAT
jgi:hypothetical protein